MKSVEQFNALRGVVNRDQLSKIARLAQQEGQDHVAARLRRVLASNPDKKMHITIAGQAIEAAPKAFLNGVDFEPSHEEFSGLAKGVSSKDIYQMIVDRMVEMVKQASGKGYKKKWADRVKKPGYLIPFNFVSKKRYRGVNVMLLRTGFGPMDNPFFMTFKQVEEAGGIVKKGSRGYPVVYFTNLYSYAQVEPVKLNFATYDRGKFAAWLMQHKAQIPLLSDLSIDELVYQSTVPILKYYNVFNGADIEGIDFDLENFKIGYVEIESGNNNERMEVADAIVEHYPDPAPRITHGGDRAFYQPATDYVQMPELSDFETSQDYYRTLFHELAHSTGHPKRLKRDFTGRFGDKKYAFEELIAEWGATFLSAEAGIIWHNNNNHAEYLKNWNNVLTFAGEDTKFIMRAASAAQKLTDYVLQFDQDGQPRYYHELKKKIEQPTQAPEATKNRKPKKADPKPEAKKPANRAKARPGKPSQEKSKAAAVKNPEPYAVKPKSVSAKAAIDDILSTGKYRISPMQAGVLYGLFKNDPDAVVEFTDYHQAILSKIDEDFVSLYDGQLTDRGRELVQAIANRQKSLRNQKHNYALFPGLKSPHAQQDQQAPASTPAAPAPQVRPGSLAERMKGPRPEREYYRIDDADIASFLGQVEKKPKESVVITLTGGKGSMKTRMLFRMMNAFGKHYACGHASIEEHPESAVYESKVLQYLSEEALHNIVAPEIRSTVELHQMIQDCDVVFIDSYAKLKELDPGFEVDKDLRKRYDGKLFIVIFQQTADGRMRGGSKSEYDGDIVLHTAAFADYRENYVYPSKNRYNAIPLDELKYNIFQGVMIRPEQDPEPEPVSLSFTAKITEV